MLTKMLKNSYLSNKTTKTMAIKIAADNDNSNSFDDDSDTERRQRPLRPQLTHPMSLHSCALNAIEMQRQQLLVLLSPGLLVRLLVRTC